jgi:hypothetical protein
MSYELGILSSAYESSGNPGAINPHDDTHGGRSYGAYQFYSGANVVQSFVEFMTQSADALEQQMGHSFDGLICPSDLFDAMWKQNATNYPKEFLAAQHNYCKTKYFDAAIQHLKDAGIDMSQRSDVIQNAIWSFAVQYGASRVPEIFKAAIDDVKAVGLDPNNDGPLISYLYFIRGEKYNKGNRRLIYRAMLEGADAIMMVKGKYQ